MQLTFNFPFLDKYLIEDFIVSSCNQTAFDFIKKYHLKDKNLPKIFAILAPKLGGKTYLAKIWQRKFAAEFLCLEELENVNLFELIKPKKFYIIEDISENNNPELLLQIFNLIQEKSASLLLTSDSVLGYDTSNIKDLDSRLRNVFSLEISSPDDALIRMLLSKNFAVKQLKVETKVIDFLVKNLGRSFADISNISKLLEFYSLERKCNINIALVREIIKAIDS